MGTRFSDYVDEVKNRSSATERAELERFEAHYARAAELLALRAQRGLTQVEVADRAGIDQAEVSRLERGAGNPTEQTLNRMAEALGARWTLVESEPDPLDSLSPA